MKHRIIGGAATLALLLVLLLLLLAVISVGIGSNALNSAIRWTFTLLCRLVGFEV